VTTVHELVATLLPVVRELEHSLGSGDFVCALRVQDRLRESIEILMLGCEDEESRRELARALREDNRRVLEHAEKAREQVLCALAQVASRRRALEAYATNDGRW
jgi:hypothetical protein